MTDQAEIAVRALTRLGVKSLGNTVDADTQSTAVDALETLHAVLQFEPVIDWELDAIPPEAVEPIINELVWVLRDDFSVPITKLQSFQSAQLEARRQLQAQYERSAGASPVEIEPY